jgi:hypothetical protein
LSLDDGAAFEVLALDVFRFQADHNKVYSRFLELMKVDVANVKMLAEIPFMPVEAFKTNAIVSGVFEPEAVFKSSGTTSTECSIHRVRSLCWYHKVSQRIFSDLVRPVDDLEWVGLLPGYLERGDSSLVEMVRSFMNVSGSDVDFFIHDYKGLENRVREKLSGGRGVCLMGVTHAILDWLEGSAVPCFTKDEIARLIIIETGGMKGHGREPIRMEVHKRIRDVLPGVEMLSEYGMTELLSQAYSSDGKYFQAPPWMRVVIKDTADPMSEVEAGRTGRVQIIDLANIDSCSFISTSDLGRKETEEGSERFEILGRFDHSEVRGCNLLSV